MQTTTLHLAATLPTSPIRPTARTAAVAALFGLPLHPSPRPLFQPFTLTLRPATITLITGPSGAGKSTLLRTIEAALQSHPSKNLSPIRLEQIPLPSNLPVVDCFPCPLETTLAHLSRAGLSEAHILLRAPAELSEGQRFRYRLAQFFAAPNTLLIADEFAATLDRITAKILAHQLQKFIHASAKTPTPKSALLATTHHDLTEDLAPDLIIYKGLSDTLHLTENCQMVK